MTPINKVDNYFNNYHQKWERSIFKWYFWEVWTHNGRHTHIITYKWIILKMSPTQVRYKTLWFWQSTHMWSLMSVTRSLSWWQSWLAAGAGNEDQGIGNTVVQGKFQMKLMVMIPVCFRTGGVNCMDISWSQLKDIANKWKTGIKFSTWVLSSLTLFIVFPRWVEDIVGCFWRNFRYLRE